MLNQISSGVYMSDRSLIVMGQKSSFLIEPGYDAVLKNGVKNSSVQDIIEFSEQNHHPITNIYFSHSHPDHTGNLSFYLKYLKEKKIAKKIYCHSHSEILPTFLEIQLLTEQELVKIDSDREYNIDGIQCVFLCTPGHTRTEEDLCIYLPEYKILFAGDLIQPQGKSYEKSDGVSPVPFFYEGNLYIQSIEKLLRIDFDTLITGHAEVIFSQDARNALLVTKICLERIYELAKEKAPELKYKSEASICEEIYEQIVKERNFGLERLQNRKNVSIYKKSDYEIYDLPGIRYFLHQVK